MFSTLILDMHFFNGRGGRVLPMLHPDGEPNIAPQLLAQLSQRIGTTVTTADLAAYIGGVVGHPAFTERFTDELTTPGIHVPITTDPSLFAEVTEMGRQLIWIVTYGHAFADPEAGRALGSVLYSGDDKRRIRNLTPVGAAMPDRITYDPLTETIHIGEGSFGPVTERVWEYDVGGMSIIRHWFDYRKSKPSGKHTSPLDDVHVTTWPLDWITDFNELLTALRRVTELEEVQATLLDRVLNGTVINAAELASEGVRFPVNSKDRRPRYGFLASDDNHQDTLI